MELNVVKKSKRLRIASSLLLAGFVWPSTAGLTRGQFKPFTQNKDNIKIDTSGFPSEIQRDYQLFRVKCNVCHGLDPSLKASKSPAQWSFEVKRMQAMASSHFNDAQATAILAFLTYDEAHRKSLNKPTVPSAPSGIVDAGRQFYKEQGCDSCHVIGGEGGSGGPSLSDVGKRLSRERISNIIRGLRSGQPGSGMPPLPSETTDQQVHDLIEFLRLAET